MLAVSVALPRLGWSQFSPENAAMNSMSKGKWERAKGQLRKAIRKDSVNAAAHYGLSVYYFSPTNSEFHIDSAYQYIMRATADLQLTPQKQRDRLRKFPLDSVILVQQRAKIDSAAFERAKQKNTEFAYIDFLNRFPLASQRMRAAELRDEVAYLDALKENTYVSFLKYLEKYPESNRASEARARYEKLVYEANTKDKKLASYESFLIAHPTTPYRHEAEQQIFEISTASGEVDDFEKFLKKYPKSSKASAARNIVYHLLKENDRTIAAGMLTDSIKALEVLERGYLVPFLKSDRFGFMNEVGEEIIKPTIAEINDEYLCGNIVESLLVLGDKIIARNGAVVYTGPIQELDDLGNGFLKVVTPTCIKVIHHSGMELIKENCFQDAELLGSNFLILKRDKRWSLWTLTGRMLVPFEWDEIQQLGEVLAFGKNGKFKLARFQDVAKVADQFSLTVSQEFDEVKSVSGNLIWARRGEAQGVLTQDLKEWIVVEKQEITPSFFGLVSRTDAGYTLYTKTSGSTSRFYQVMLNQPWVAVQANGTWQLFDPQLKKAQSPAFDSISFTGPFSIGWKGDSLNVYTTKHNVVEISQRTQVQFLPGKDSLYFMLLEEGDKKTLYNEKGELLFPVPFDKIEYNNEGFFTVIKNNKRGLLSLEGRLIVPTEYDAMGTVTFGVVPVLKDKRFGSLDIVHHKEIKNEYDKNIMRYNASTLIASKNGFLGLIGWDNKPVTPFEYEEIRFWNDSLAIVKKNFRWIIYNFIEKRVILDNIKTFKWVTNTEQEKIMIVQQENSVGVISNKKGVIIPTTFTDIVNVGSESVPLYFTEKHVEEASIYVVIYYDKTGKQLRRQVYEADDYEKLYCSGK